MEAIQQGFTREKSRKLKELWEHISFGTAQMVYSYPLIKRLFGEERARKELCDDIRKIREKLKEMGYD